MTEQTPEKVAGLIAEARKTADRIRNVIGPSDRYADMIDNLADALEATVREMHARELHHFESESAMSEALEFIQPGRFMRPDEPGYLGTTRDVEGARRVLRAALSGIPEHPKED